MKTTVLLLFSLLLSAFASAQVPILYYDFEDNTHAVLDTLPDQSVNAGSSGIIRRYDPPTPVRTYAPGAGTTYGGTAGIAYSSNKWPSSNPGPQTNDYVLFNTSSNGFKGLTLSFDAKASEANLTVVVAWALGANGTPPLSTAYTAAGSQTATTGGFSNLPFVLPAATENQTDLYVKIYAYNASNNLTSNALILDNLTLSANTVVASKTLLNYAAVGLSLTAGTPYQPVYNDLKMNGAGMTASLGGDLALKGALTLDQGTLAVGANTLTIKGTIGRTTGVITAGSGTVAFNGTAAQSIAAGVFSGAVKNLTINNTMGVTTTVDFTVTNTLDLTAGTLNLGTTTLSLGGNVTRASGTINAANGTVVFNGTSSPQSIAAGVFAGTVNNLTVSNSLGVNTAADLTLTGTLALTAGTYNTGSSTQTIKGSITRSAGDINTGNGAMVFSGTAAQSIPANTFTGGVKDLAINNAAGVTTAGSLIIGNSLSLTAGTLAVGTNTVTINGNAARTAGAISANAGGIVFSGTAPQSVPAGTFTGSIKDLTINNTAGVSTADNTTISNSLLLTGGTYDAGTSTQTISGTINRSAGTINAAAGSLVFNGLAAQNIPAGSVSATIKNLTVGNAAGVTINDDYTVATALALESGFLALNGKTLTLGGTVSGSGTLRGSSASALTVAASGVAGTLNFDQTTDGATNALALMSVSSGTATLGSKLNIYTALNIAGGTFDLAAKNLVLKSGASQTAYVAEIRGTLAGETNVTVERYIPAWSSRRWRLLTAPVSNTTISAAWQEGSTWNGTTTIPATGTGTLITGQQQGTAAAANAKGFDFWTAIANASSSLRYYAAATSSHQATWQPVSSTLTADAFGNNQAYLLFVRGDRSLSIGSTVGATTLRPNGSMKKGSFTISVPNAYSHTLIGNPYPSPLDFKAIYDANNSKIQQSFYKWQAALGTGTGGYVLMRPISSGSNLYEAIPGDGSKSEANRMIQSGEGFFVMPATTATADNSVTIQESHKTITTPTVSVFRTFRQMDVEPAKLYVNLYDGAGQTKILLDGALSQYTNVTTSFSAGDNFGKPINNTENLSLLKAGSDMIVISGNLPKAGDTLKLRLWNTTVRTYQLQLKSANFGGAGVSAVLVDKFQNKQTPLILGDAVTEYTFAITADAASKDVSRFFVVFGSASTLPLSLTSFKAEVKSKSEVNVQWKVTDETEIKTYVLEKSTVNTGYVAVFTQDAMAQTSEMTYNYVDQQPAAINYYRVKMVGTNGAVKYSGVVRAQLQSDRESISVYPNPVTEDKLNIALLNKPAGRYTLALYNTAGQSVIRKIVQHMGGNSSESIDLGQGMAAGIYHLEVRNDWGTSEVLQVSVRK